MDCWRGFVRLWSLLQLYFSSGACVPENHDVRSPVGGHGDHNGEVLRRGVVLNRQNVSVRQLTGGCSLGETMERHSGLARRREDRDLQTFGGLADISDALFPGGSDLVCVAEESNTGGTDRRDDHECILATLQIRAVGLACRQCQTLFAGHIIDVSWQPYSQCRRCDGPAKVCVHHLLFPRYEGETV